MMLGEPPEVLPDVTRLHVRPVHDAVPPSVRSLGWCAVCWRELLPGDPPAAAGTLAKEMGSWGQRCILRSRVGTYLNG